MGKVYIKLKKRTEGEQKAYAEGYAAGKRDAVRHGRWENDGHTLACSNCHTINIRGIAWDYCPHCGAKMDIICSFLSDEEVKQPCIEGPCGFECEKMDEVEE